MGAGTGLRLGLLAATTAIAVPWAAGGAAPRASLSKSPAKLVVGRTWAATLTVRPAPATAPAVTGRLGKRAVSFPGRPLGKGRYRVRLAFPAAGRWTLATRLAGARRALGAVTVGPLPPPTSPLPGATAFRACSGDGMPYPQYALALGAGSAWVACAPRNAVERYDESTGRLLARIPVGYAVWSITAGSGAVWALSRNVAEVVRIDPATNRIAARIALDDASPYLWAAAGSVWVGDDNAHALLRIDPGTNRVVARIPVGDGPAALAFDGTYAWVLNHRENTLDRVDPATNAVVRLGRLDPTEQVALERLAIAGGSLWITGRGADLLRVSPATGKVLGTTEIGPAGLEVVFDGMVLHAVAYDAVNEPLGNPVVGAVHAIDGAGAVSGTIAPTRKLFANGVAAADGRVWIVDTVNGLLLRLP